MSKRRTVTVALTETEFDALFGALGRAVDEWEAEIEGEADEFSAATRRRIAATDRAREKVYRSWDRAGTRISEYHEGTLRGLVEMHGAEQIVEFVRKEGRR